MLKNFKFLYFILYFFILNSYSQKIQSRKKNTGSNKKNNNKALNNFLNNQKRQSKSAKSTSSTYSRSTESTDNSISSNESELNFNFDIERIENDKFMNKIERMILFINNDEVIDNNKKEKVKIELIKEHAKELIVESQKLKDESIDIDNKLKSLNKSIKDYEEYLKNNNTVTLIKFLSSEIDSEILSKIEEDINKKNNSKKTSISNSKKSSFSKSNRASVGKNSKKSNKKANNLASTLRNKILKQTIREDFNLNEKKENIIKIEDLTAEIFSMFIDTLKEHTNLNKLIQNNKSEINNIIVSHIKYLKNIQKNKELSKEHKQINTRLKRYFDAIVKLIPLDEGFAKYINENATSIFTKSYLNDISKKESPRLN